MSHHINIMTWIEIICKLAFRNELTVLEFISDYEISKVKVKVFVKSASAISVSQKLPWISVGQKQLSTIASQEQNLLPLNLNSLILSMLDQLIFGSPIVQLECHNQFLDCLGQRPLLAQSSLNHVLINQWSISLQAVLPWTKNPP